MILWGGSHGLACNPQEVRIGFPSISSYISGVRSVSFNAAITSSIDGDTWAEPIVASDADRHSRLVAGSDAEAVRTYRIFLARGGTPRHDGRHQEHAEQSEDRFPHEV